MPGHSAGLDLPYDPDQARQLLAEAGYPSSGGVGRDFPVVELVVSYGAHTVGEYLQAQWRENLGVEIAWEAIESSEGLLDRLDREPAHLFLVYWMADYPDPDNFMRLGVNFARSYTHWQNETYDRLVEQARRVMDQRQRMGLYEQADQILVQDAAIVPLTYPRWHMLVKPWVSRFLTSAIREWFWKDVIIEPH
jgi:ABC-type transport system substrate-binding protein